VHAGDADAEPVQPFVRPAGDLEAAVDHPIDPGLASPERSPLARPVANGDPRRLAEGLAASE
jgi:hypothetical protein